MKLLLFALMIGACSPENKSDPRKPVPPAEGSTSGSPLELKDVTAAALLDVIAAHKGKSPLLVNFWATWCAPCVEEFPILMSLKKEYAGKMQFIFVSMDFEEARGGALKFLKEQGLKGDSYFKNQPDQEFLKVMPEEWSGALPFTMLYDRNGNMTGGAEGGQTKNTFARLIKSALAS